MKSFKLRATSLTMAFTILFSSIGYGVFEHTCHFTQKKSVTLSQDDHCCSDDTPDETNSFRKAKCCSITKTLAKVNVSKYDSPTLAANFQVLATNSVANFFIFLSFAAANNPALPTLANAPPISLRTFLALIQTYLI